MVNLFQKNKVATTTVVILAIAVFIFLAHSYFQQKSASVLAENTLRTEIATFTPDELKRYDGTDPTLPIYLALDGKVYDVSPGKEYYKSGGPYHSLAGRDSSMQLHIAGGSIIEKKYKIVGRLIK